MNKSNRTPKGHNRVFWTIEERRLIISAAVATQRNRPDLSGLPLLREAMRSLPADRKRQIISLSQVPWFEEGIQTEVLKRRSEEDSVIVDPLIPIAKLAIDKLDRIIKSLTEIVNRERDK